MLRNVIKYQEGLHDALSASLVETLVSLLSEGKPLGVKREASTTLSVACFDDIAKNIAVQVVTIQRKQPYNIYIYIYI